MNWVLRLFMHIAIVSDNLNDRIKHFQQSILLARQHHITSSFGSLDHWHLM
uniref:Uncharacterized protein n=1 Tax=Setaria italica TaxID=4555 RepID=K4A4D5_SETIT